MVKLKALGIGVALAMASVSSPVMAADVFAGNGRNDIVDGSGRYGDSQIPVGPFTDIIKFTVNTGGTTEVSLNYIFRTNGITSLSAYLNGEKLDLVQVGPNYRAGSIIQTYPGAFTHTLTISGISNGPNATYSGDAVFTAVPEPATWGLMILGFGAVGVTLRRRQSAGRTLQTA